MSTSSNVCLFVGVDNVFLLPYYYPSYIYSGNTETASLAAIKRFEIRRRTPKAPLAENPPDRFPDEMTFCAQASIV